MSLGMGGKILGAGAIVAVAAAAWIAVPPRIVESNAAPADAGLIAKGSAIAWPATPRRAARRWRADGRSRRRWA